MTPAQLDHLRAIDEHLTNLLAIAEKRTPGRWAGDWNRIRSDQCATVCFANSYEPGKDDTWIADKAFIAACAGNAEAGWRATKTAIAGLLDFEELDPHLQMMVESAQAAAILRSILAAWPLPLA